MSDKKDFQPVSVLCLGTRVGLGSKRLTAIRLLDIQGEPYGDPAYFAHMKKVFPTGVYTMDIALDEGGGIMSVRDQTAKFTGTLVGEEACTVIRLEHEAAETQLTAASQVKKAKNDKTCVLETLRPLRKLWASTNHAGQLALEVRVLNYLRNGTDL
ncbi:MAG: hypothetical protein JKX78_02850 [Alteromonadaceae bacterium]|nr:hypothetical protein [Alteromonadaceae bacterium]